VEVPIAVIEFGNDYFGYFGYFRLFNLNKEVNDNIV
jgi:hypothetical protein